jgi:hypothetical protein
VAVAIVDIEFEDRTGEAIIHTLGDHGFVAGQTILISGTSDPYYNRRWVVKWAYPSALDTFGIAVSADAPYNATGGEATAFLITFEIPKVPFEYVDDDGNPQVTQLEIYQTFPVEDETATYESATVTLAASSDLDAEFVYTSSDPAVAIIFDGNKLKMLQRADVTITASQEDEFGPASASVTISPPPLAVPQTLTITAPETMKVGEYAAFSYSSSSGLPVTVRSFSPEIVEITADGRLHALLPGGSILEFSAPGEDGFQETSETRFVFVEGLAQTLTFTAIGELQVGDEVTLSATSSAGLAIAFTSSDPAVMSVTGNKLKVLRQGLATITATAAVSTTYNPASAAQEVVVGSSEQAIVFPAIPEIPYGAAGYAVDVSATSGLPVTLTSSNPSVAIVLGSTQTLSIGGVGTTTITASQAGNGYWLPAASQSQLLRVVKADPGLVFTRPPGLIALGDRVRLDATTTSGGAVQFFAAGSLTLSNGEIVGQSIGSGTIRAVVAETATHNAASITYDVAVGKLPQTISFSEVGVKSYTDFPFRLDVAADSQLPVTLSSSDERVIELTDGNLATIKGTGVATIAATQVGSSIYEPAANVAIQIAVERGFQSIEFEDIAPIAYGSTGFSLRASAPGGAVEFATSNPAVATVQNGNQLVIQGIGVARIIATQDGNQNYFGTAATQSVIVLPTIAGAVSVPTNKSDVEAHNSLAVSPATSAAAVNVPAPTIEDRETHAAMTASPVLNCGGAAIAPGVRDTESHESGTKSPSFSGAAFDMNSVPQGADESEYAVAASPTFNGASATVGTPTEVDLSDYRAWLKSAATSATGVVAKYDGRNEFEIYFAPTAYEPVGFLKWAASGYILNRRTNEDGRELKGKIAI